MNRRQWSVPFLIGLLLVFTSDLKADDAAQKPYYEMSLEELINSCKFLENKLLKVISWLTENEKILLTKENKYKWK